jgi:flavin reductase (DIM6/NTAB) family NADH-FMN oxidoreductase RutF
VADAAFDDLMGMLDVPALVVTTAADGQPAGCLVGFATQTSLEPPTFLVAISRNSHTFEVASKAQHLAVHVLPRHRRALAELFGGQTGREVNKFERCSWRAGPHGMPILDDAMGWFVGRTVNWADVGDYEVYVLVPVATWASDSDEEPLYLSDIDDIDPGGHEEAAAKRLYDAPSHVAHRYGPRFTIGGI